ncbi:MAG: T9SS type A sorting domain-containing protein [Aureispira sp.]|nr:T9SS type A sorting domain-containing protein [Aureispira sp.]
MRAIANNNGRIRLYGHDPDTLYTAEIPIYTEIEVRAYAYYHIIGNYRGHYLEGQTRSRIHADGIRIDAYAMRLDSGYFNNVYAHLTQNRTHTRFGGNLGSFAGGANMDYQGTTTFELSALHATAGTPILNLGQNEVMPNVIANHRVSLVGYNRSSTVKGDLILKDNLAVYWAAAHLKVLGTMPLYEGDLYVTAGKTYRFNGGSLIVNDTLHSIGTCTEYINWLAAATGFTVSLGGDDIAYSFITGWKNNNANPTINAVNSIDGGNNNNVDFPISGTGVTYYWRADANDATDFEGAWNNPDHWTTNPNDLTGTLGGCLPTLVDTVVFDTLSFSATSNGCTVSSGSYCHTIITISNIELLGGSQLYVANSVWLDPSTIYNHTGDINLVGADTGYIDTDGILVKAGLKFSNAGGVWHFVSDHVGERGFFLYKGNVHTNGYYISKHGVYAASGATLDIRNSHIDVTSILPICCYTAWDVANGTTVLADNSYIDLHPATSSTTSCRMGNHTYNDVRFYAGAHQLNITGSANYSHVDAVTTCRFYNSNSFDSLTLHGNRFYYFNNGTTQTLNAPYGKIIIANDAGPGNFVNIETVPSGGTSYFHKEYGTAFCVDWVKVADSEGTKGATPPAAWVAAHTYLQFETGENSDNINNSATGIWAFDLPAILTVTSAHADTLDFCAGDTTVLVPLTMTGTYPYSIVYSWTDIWGNTGLDTIIENDDDNDILTPHVYNLALNPWTTTDYTIDIAALRCGARNYGAPIKPLHLRLPKNPIVTTDRTGSCVLNNNSVWAHFVDDIDQKPMLSILDSTSTTDSDALGLVNVQTNFDGTVQSWNGKPYLPRHWKVDAANSTGGYVRLYFTQQDLDKLGLATYNGLAPIVGSELILWEFDDTITVGAPTQIPFTVIPLAGRAADQFSNTTDIYAIEFQVSSFSGFMLQVTDLGLFPLELLSFEAEAVDNKQVELKWATEEEINVSHFVLERSRDGVNFEAIGGVAATQANYYQFVDEKPYYGTGYYRMQIIDNDGTFKYSDIRTVVIEGTDLVAIAPNPVTNKVLNIGIRSTLEGTIHLNIFDAIGQLVAHKKSTIKAHQVNNLQMDVQHLNSGIYTLQLIDSRGELRTEQFRVK